MFNLKFGLTWTTIVSIIFGICIFVPADVRNGVELSLPLIIVFLIFEAVGISLIVSGAKIVIADKKTDMNGEITYGKIINIFPTGSYQNGRAELKAEVVAYIPRENYVRIFEEIINFNEKHYQIGDYLLLKQFEDDINILLAINKSKVPVQALEKIDDNIHIEYSDDITTIDYSNDTPTIDYIDSNSNTSDRSFRIDDLKNDILSSSSDEERAQIVTNFIKENSQKIQGILFIIHGTIWNILILSIFYLPKYFTDYTDTTYYRNGVQVTKDEFYTFGPIAPFLIIGTIIIIIGILKLKKSNNQ